MMKKWLLFLACIPLCLFTFAACHGGQGDTETTGVTEAVSAPSTSPDDPTDTTAPVETAPVETAVEASPSESDTEVPETNQPDFTPAVLPSANVARDGFAIASSVKWNVPWNTFTPTYSNVHLNDGDSNTVWATEWGPNPDRDPPL